MPSEGGFRNGPRSFSCHPTSEETPASSRTLQSSPSAQSYCDVEYIRGMPEVYKKFRDSQGLASISQALRASQQAKVTTRWLNRMLIVTCNICTLSGEGILNLAGNQPP